MIVKKNISLKSILEFTGYHLLWLAGWMSFVTIGCHILNWELLEFSWLPLPLIGTAVVFYIGFKNNQSYDRLWEARKLWSEITNSSRVLATMVRHYRSGEMSEIQEDEIRRQIVFRHIAYIYQLRDQLLQPAVWENLSQKSYWGTGYYNRRHRDKLHKSFAKELEEIAKKKYLPAEESVNLQHYKNKAVQLLNMQTEMIQQLYDGKAINMIQQIELQSAVKNFYDGQGKMERIKQSPFPREYSSFSFIFICIFILLLPFGLISEFSRLGKAGIWLTIPVGIVIGWIFVAMEMISDYCENPFEGLRSDTPMLSICREIEINMLQTIGEKNIPAPITPKNHVLI
ncbi:bestrophin family protein [Dyadobacter subterraneus]|uniref:Multidrug transporter n=1 Tax=Dyadobacter subterraneus TaxID=2773304 RepID=A0ABR9WG06_9BACT|nr:bestrophin family ion channel [Dyadobacter subterraneus]MBE9463266.1 hypothetical protein [Dyadobacter subterraneus]